MLGQEGFERRILTHTGHNLAGQRSDTGYAAHGLALSLQHLVDAFLLQLKQRIDPEIQATILDPERGDGAALSNAVKSILRLDRIAGSPGPVHEKNRLRRGERDAHASSAIGADQDSALAGLERVNHV